MSDNRNNRDDDDVEELSSKQPHKAPHQNTKDYYKVLDHIRKNPSYDVTKSLPAMEIRTKVEMNEKYPSVGPWKNFITRIHKILIAERLNSNRTRVGNEMRETVQLKPPAVPTREEAVEKANPDKQSDWYTQRIIDDGGEVEMRLSTGKFGLPLVVVAWRDLQQRRRCTIYIHLLSGTKARHIDFQVADDMMGFEFFYQWHEDFKDALTVLGAEKKMIAALISGPEHLVDASLEAYYLKKKAYQEVMGAVIRDSDYGAEGQKTDRMLFPLPFPCEEFADPGTDPSTHWSYKINTILKRQDEGVGKPTHDLVKVFTAELIGLHEKEAVKKSVEEVYHSPSKTPRSRAAGPSFFSPPSASRATRATSGTGAKVGGAAGAKKGSGASATSTGANAGVNATSTGANAAGGTSPWQPGEDILVSSDDEILNPGGNMTKGRGGGSKKPKTGLDPGSGNVVAMEEDD